MIDQGTLIRLRAFKSPEGELSAKIAIGEAPHVQLDIPERHRLEGDTDVIVERSTIYDDNVNGSIEESNIATIVYYWV
jgi:hypothetical protein